MGINIIQTIVLFLPATIVVIACLRLLNVRKQQGDPSVNVPIFSQPVINVVFSHDDSEEDNVAQAIADMYIKGRAYFYSGQPIPDAVNQDNKVYIRYNSINFSEYKEVII
jgi:hypothetical protein